MMRWIARACLLSLLTCAGCDGCHTRGLPRPASAGPWPPVAVVAAPVAASSSAWEMRGVGGGGALYLPVIAPDNQQIFMATDMGSLFHSRDFGASWDTLDFRSFQGSPRTQVRFTADPNVLWSINAIREDAKLSRSLDGGRHWQASPRDSLDGSPYYLEVDPERVDRLLVSTRTALFVSRDGGATFQSVTIAPRDAGLILAGAFFDGDQIDVATNVGLFHSADGGASFAQRRITGIPAGEVIISFAGAHQGEVRRFFAVTASDADVWAGVQGSQHGAFRGIYRLDESASQGEVVVRAMGGRLPREQHMMFVGMARNAVDVAYLAGCDASRHFPAVFRTEDSGTTWTDVFVTHKNRNIATGWSADGGKLGWDFGEYALGFAVSPSDPRRAVLTDLGFVHVTTDGGANWQAAYVAPADRNPPGTAILGGKPYRSSGVEQTSVWWLTFASPETLIASFTDIRGARSVDGGRSWSPSPKGLVLNTTYQVIADPRGTLYAATSSVHDLYQSLYLTDGRIDKGTGAVMTSANQGATWQLLHDFRHPVVFLALDRRRPSTLYAAVVHSREGGIYLTHDLERGPGATWNRLSVPPRTQGHPYNIRPLADGTLLVTYSGRQEGQRQFTDSSGVFVSSDDGFTWVDRSAPNMHFATKDLVVDANDATESTWYVGVAQPAGAMTRGLYRTRDRGLAWQRIWDGASVESCSFDPRTPDRLFVTTTEDGLWRTENVNTTQPDFLPDRDYPFLHPLRLFWHPSNPGEAWVTSFGGGLRARTF